MLKKFLNPKVILILSISFISVFFIYKSLGDDRIQYVALGDSLAAGQNPYGEISFGYSDYLANYLNKNKMLRDYLKEFAQSGYRTKDILADIELGKTVTHNDKEVNIKEALREANLITISIGANDFLGELNLQNIEQSLSSLTKLNSLVDTIMNNVDQVLKSVRFYAKGKVVLVGYYNPLPVLYKSNPKEVDQLFAYVKEKYLEVCSKYQVTYVDIYECMKKDASYLPNPFDIHPSSKGYEAIANEIISSLEKNT